MPNINLNTEEPLIMHIDLNSAFATIEQQSRPSLRNKPIGVTNRISKNCCVIAASYQAKRLGIKVGMPLSEAKRIAPGFIILESDPAKYHYIYQKLIAIMKKYSPDIKMKSIDEGIIDFHSTRSNINTNPLEIIGYEIKNTIKREIGSIVTVNIGIGPNQFLAKVAASLHKPDGMDIINHRNLLNVYRSLKLTDLPGIAEHYQARLNASNIFSPIDFLNATSDTLKRTVFNSIIGEDWYYRLRGFEMDNIQTKLGQVGRQWVLNKPTGENNVLTSALQYLCQTTGKKLRYENVDARGVLVWLNLVGGEGWYQRKMFKTSFYSDYDIYRRAVYLLNQRPAGTTVQAMGITCYGLSKTNRHQISLFDEINKTERLTDAIDIINENYGVFKILSANSLMGDKLIKQKIPFGGTEYFQLLISSS